MAESCHETEFTVSADPKIKSVLIAGNPNSGKSTVFNLLTGMRQRIGNYPGVTVERKSGPLLGHEHVEVVDLPGSYSLNPKSLDEQIAYEAIASLLPGEVAPDVIVCVVNATHLERNLYLASQILDMGLPTVVVLNMMDELEGEGLKINVAQLQDELGAPVIPMVATRGEGLDKLRKILSGAVPIPARTGWNLSDEVEAVIESLSVKLGEIRPDLAKRRRRSESLRTLNSDRLLAKWERESEEFVRAVLAARGELDDVQINYSQAEVMGRYYWLGKVVACVTSKLKEVKALTVSDRLDAVLIHRVFGPIIFAAILLLVFQSIFSWATPAMDLIELGMLQLGSLVRTVLPPGMVTDLLVEGVIAGVGNVILFLPQILLLFFFLSLMESTGYMARTAFIMDRVMRRVGLTGGSVMPMMSGFACAIPAIMATRTMDSQRDRLLTILVVPLMSCSARLPVYTLFIAAFIPSETLFGPFGYQSVTMFSLYIFGTITAFVAAGVLSRIFKGPNSSFVIELPPYRVPQWKLVFWRMYDRAKVFMVTAGKIIFVFSIVIWFAASFPRTEMPIEAAEQREIIESELNQNADLSVDRTVRLETELQELANAEASRQIEFSLIGRLGKFIEPVMRPLGFDWKLSAGLLSAFAAREVIIGALGTIYSVADADENSLALRDHLKNARDARTGQLVYRPLVALSLLVFFVLALQCSSTLAIAKRELNSWKWPTFMWVYMTTLAYLASLAVYQGGSALGF